MPDAPDKRPWGGGEHLGVAGRIALYERVARIAADEGERPFDVCKRLGASIELYNSGRCYAAEKGRTVSEVPSNDPAAEKAPEVEKKSRMSDEQRAAAAERMRKMRAEGLLNTGGPRRPRDQVLAEKREKLMRHVDKMRKVGFTIYLPGEAPQIADVVDGAARTLAAGDERAMYAEPDDDVEEVEDDAEEAAPDPTAELVVGQSVRVYVLEGGVDEVAQLMSRWTG